MLLEHRLTSHRRSFDCLHVQHSRTPRLYPRASLLRLMFRLGFSHLLHIQEHPLGCPHQFISRWILSSGCLSKPRSRALPIFFSARPRRSEIRAVRASPCAAMQAGRAGKQALRSRVGAIDRPPWRPTDARLLRRRVGSGVTPHHARRHRTPAHARTQRTTGPTDQRSGQREKSGRTTQCPHASRDLG